MTTTVTVPAGPTPARSEERRGGARAWIALILVCLARVYRAFLLTLVATAVIPAAWGWHGYVVQSGSMEPGISRGDVVSAAPFTRAEAVPVGKVMIFANPARPEDRTPLIHRVVSDDGNGMFTTKGDANRADDTAPVPRNNFQRRAVLLAPFVGLPLLWATTGAVVPLAGWLVLTGAALYGAGAPGRQKRRAARADGPVRAGRSPHLPRRRAGARGITSAAATVATVAIAVAAGPTLAAFSARTTDQGNSWAIRVVPSLALSYTPVKPGTSTTGTLARFVGGESLQYRLDAPAGTVLAGSLAGKPTPALIPAGGGGSVVVAVPVGTGDGAHTVYAVASPSGATAAATIVVDGTAPPVPVLTLTPAAISGAAATFAFTESEASATVGCRLDGAPYAVCSSPAEFAALGAGPHTFQAHATDTLGNVSASVSYTWIVDLSVPTIAIDFPEMSARYNDGGFDADCDTALIGDVCGTADDDLDVTAISVSLRHLSTGLWWNGTTFSAAAETFAAAAGTIQWSYAVPSTALAEGDYTLRARASDGANVAYDSRTFTIDRTAPATPTLSAVPPAPSGPSATFAFADADPTARFECRLDAGTWTACSSPKIYNNLSGGSHGVNVRAVDEAGNTSAGTTTTWTVDATAPTASMTFPTGTSYNVASWAAGCGTSAIGDVCGTAGDVGSGVVAVAVSIQRVSTHSYWDGAAFAAANETWLGVVGTAAWSRAFAGADFPADGAYTVRWRVTDAVGNASAGGVDLTLDTTPPPAPRIVQSPPDPSGATGQFDFTDAESGTVAECRIDSAAWAGCTAPVGFSGLATGLHTFSVRATDAAGNVSATVSHTWTVKIALPTIGIGFPVADRSYNNTTFAAGCSSPAGDLCGTASDPQGSVTSVGVSIRSAATSLYWNGTTFGSATEVFLAATGTTSWSYAMAAASFPTEAGYTLHARATNNAGLTGFDTATITIDRTAPAAPIITAGPTGTTVGADTFAFTGEAAAILECRVDAGSWAACTSPRTPGALADGSHTFSLRATDAAGNTGATTSRTWTIDATPPTVGTTFPAVGAGYNNTTWAAGCGTGSGDFCGTATDAGTVSLVEVAIRRSSTGLYWNGTAFSASSPSWRAASGTASWSFPFTATGFPADDTYELSTRATDAPGNVSSPTSTTFVIDRTGPGASSLAAINLGQTVRRIETGDKLTLTFTEPIAPGSVIAGWNGTGAQNIVVRQADNADDQLTFYNATNTTRLPLGAVLLRRSDYVLASVVWGAGSTHSTLTMSGATLTITFGAPDSSLRVWTAGAAANMSWSPRDGVSGGAGVTDLIGNLGSSTARAETDLDSDF